MNSPGQPIAPAFDTAQAVQLGLFIEMAYSMYANAPGNPAPPPPSPFITDYKFVAWVQLRDFVFEDGSWMFYGLLAQHTSKANEFVLAIRGTSNLTEWFIVPKLPPIGFTHVATEYSYTSGSTVDWSLSCWHELATYLNLLDPAQPISPECRWPQHPPAAAKSLLVAAKLAAPPVIAVAPVEKKISLPAPSGQGGTINITIKIGEAD